MKISLDSLSVELTCGHEVCIKCIMIAMPLEESEITCNQCDSPQRIKHDNSRR